MPLLAGAIAWGDNDYESLNQQGWSISLSETRSQGKHYRSSQFIQC